MGQRRYPGATPFSKEQARIFYGRNNDIQRLLTLVRVERKVLLYGKSGLGKTSLLEAGVIPRLPKNIIPVSIRFYARRNDSLSPVGGVLTALENTLGKLDDMPPCLLDNLETTEKERKTLWYYFKKLQLSQAQPKQDAEEAEEPRTYLLVFDQFEELFSYSKTEIEEFKQQFYELAEQNVPERYAELIAPARRKNREKFNRKALGEIHQKTSVKTVFAIRSDRLSLLNQLSDKITDIQQTFYEIKPLTNEQAKEAVVNPAKDPSEDFETSPYTFQKDAINKIIDELTKKETGSENIETTQLQIVCHRIEEIASQKHNAQSGSSQVEIEKKDLPNFKNIFLDFYEDSIERLKESSRDKAKRMIEDELIRSKQRISLDENICKEFLSAEELKDLVDTHLLRAERNSFGRFSFELSHDTLVEPILESKRIYDEEERLRKLKEKNRKDRLERDKEMKRMQETQRRKTRWQRTIIGIVSFFLIISLGLGFWGYRNFCATARESIKTLNKQREATMLLINFKEAQYEEFFEKGETSMKNALYPKAIENFEEAKKNLHAIVAGKKIDTSSNCDIRELFTNSVKNEISRSNARYMDSLVPIAKRDSAEKLKILTGRINKSVELASKDSIISRLYAVAQQHIRNKDFVEALRLFKEAHRQDPNKSETRKRFDDARRDGTKFYESTMRNAAEIPDTTEETRARQLLNQVKAIQL